MSDDDDFEKRDSTDSCELLKSHDGYQNIFTFSRRDEGGRRNQRIQLILVVALFVLSNLGWTYFYVLRPQGHESPNYYNAYDIRKTFHFDWTNLQPEKDESRYAEKLWNSSFPFGSGRVALSQDVVKMLGLPPSVPAKQDNEKRVYQIAGFHQIHCLQKIREVIYASYDRENNPEDDGKPVFEGTNWDHVIHCVEAVRQGLTCRIDETLLAVKETWPPLGDGSGQERTCKDFDALRDWASANYGNENRQWSVGRSD